MVDRIARMRDDLSQRLLQRDAPPLWSAAAYAPSGDPSFVPAKLRAAAARRLDLFDEFRKLTITRLEIEASVFALVLAALLAARRRSRGEPEPDEVDRALTVSRRILERPISAAIVVAFAVATWVLPRAPGFASEVEALLLLVPVLRLLPSELWSELRPAMLWLAGVFFVGSLRQVFSALPTVERFLILPEIFGLIALMTWIVRGDHAARLQSIGRFGACGAAVRAGRARARRRGAGRERVRPRAALARDPARRAWRRSTGRSRCSRWCASAAAP